MIAPRGSLVDRRGSAALKGGVAAAAFCLLVPVLAQAQSEDEDGISYNQIRQALFDATNQWRQEHASEIMAQSASATITLRRSILLDRIIQMHVEDKVKCGYFHGDDPSNLLNPHFSCDGTSGQDRTNAGGVTGFAENMAETYHAARDIPLSELGITESAYSLFTSNRAMFACTGYVISDGNGNERRAYLRFHVSRPASLSSAPETIEACFVGDNNEVAVLPGAIDGWDRSPDHRGSMVSASYHTLGIGHAEGVVNIDTCTNRARDSNGHLISTAGCTMGSISGQLFSGRRSEEDVGFYSVARSATMGFVFSPSDGGGNPGDGGGNPGDGGGNPGDGGGNPGDGGGNPGDGGGNPGDGGGNPGDGGGNPGDGGGNPGDGGGNPPGDGGGNPPGSGGNPGAGNPSGGDMLTDGRGPAMTHNMRVTDSALANLYLIYQIRDDLVGGGDEAALLAEAASYGYGGLTAAQIRDMPEDQQLNQFFDNMITMTLQGMRGDEAVLQALANTVRDVSPESHSVMGEDAVLTGMYTGNVLRQRLEVVRQQGVAAPQGMSKETMIAANYSAAELDGLLGLEQVLATQGYEDSSSSAWVRVLSRYSNQDPDGTLSGHETKDYGIIAGFEMPVAGDRALLGVYVGAGMSDTDYNGGVAETETKYYQVGAYGTTSVPGQPYYVHGSAGFTYMQHEHTRRPRLAAGTVTTIESDYDSWVAHASVGGGAEYKINQLVLRPEVTIGYHHHDIDAITESGSSPLRLSMAARTEKSITARAGVSGNREFDLPGDYALVLRGGVGYLHVNSDSRDNQARFAVVPGNGNSFTVQGRGNRDYYEHELGFELKSEYLLELSGGYRLLADSTSKDHSFNLGLRYQF